MNIRHLKIVTVLAGGTLAFTSSEAQAQLANPVRNTLSAPQLVPTYTSGTALSVWNTPITNSNRMDNYTINLTSNYTTSAVTGYADFFLDTSTVSRTVSFSLCRQSYSGTSVTCGTAASAAYSAATTGSYELSANASGVQSSGNSIWDYYYASVSVTATGGAAALKPLGLGLRMDG